MRVVHCKKEAYTRYIGRPDILGNPYTHKLGVNAILVPSRDEAIICYEHYAKNKKVILDEIYQLPEDAVLGCWCKPKTCHGDIIIKIWKELHNK